MSNHFRQARKDFLKLLTDTLYQAEKAPSALIKEKKEVKHISGIIHSTPFAFTLAGLFDHLKESYLVVLPTEKEAAELYHDLTNVLGEEAIGFYPELGVLPYEDISPSRYTLHKRVDALFRLLHHKPGLVVTSCIAASRRVLPKSLLLTNMFLLEAGQSYERAEMIGRFQAMGYLRVERVGALGEFAVRGEIIDIYSSSYAAPVRIDFFDETIEEMRLFNPSTQVSFETLDHFQVLPKHDNWIPPSVIEKGLVNLAQSRQAIVGEYQAWEHFKEKVSKRQVPGLQNYLSFFYDDLDVLTDYLHPKVKVIAFNPPSFPQKLQTHFKELDTYYHHRSKKIKSKLGRKSSTPRLYRTSSFPVRCFPHRSGYPGEYPNRRREHPVS